MVKKEVSTNSLNKNHSASFRKHSSSTKHDSTSSNNHFSSRTNTLLEESIDTADDSILPKKLYSVIGLESSGTKFVSRLLTTALNLTGYREGSRSFTGEKEGVQVQHFSLPWGSTCDAIDDDPPIVDVVLPANCTRSNTTRSERSWCNSATNEIWGFDIKGEKVTYPSRYILNIVSNKEWYDSRGVEQFFIIVVRDEGASYKSRIKHCHNTTAKQREEKISMDIIVDAINTYILEDEEKNVTRDSYNYWHAESLGNGRQLSALPFRNNVVVVSYESLVMLKETYIKMLYNVLNINSDFMPDIKNGNSKYFMYP